MTGTLKPYGKMKDSGVSWLGAMPTHWTTAKLKNLSRRGYKTFVDGDWVESPYITAEGIRLIQTGNVGVGKYREKGFRYISTDTFAKLRCTEIEPNDVLICRLGEPVGRSCLAPDLGVRMITSVDVCILKPRPDISAAFLVYAMSSPRYLDWVGSLVRGSTRDRISRSMLGGFVLPVPPLSEQAAIVRYLDFMDLRIRRYIRAKQQMLRLFGEQKQALVHHFVMRGLDESVCLKPSGASWLGDIPEHWSVSRSKRLFSVRKELARSGDVQLSATQAYGVIPQAEFEAKVGRKVVKISMHLEKRRHVEKDDFVISMRSFQGGLERAWESGAIRSSYVVLQPGTSVDVEFFSYLLKSPDYIQALQGTADFIRDGQDLTFDNFCRVDLPVIPLEEQKAIAAAITRAASGIASNIGKVTSELDLIREYGSRLIADVATGRFDVRDVAASLPDDLVQEEMVPDELEPVLEEELGYGDPELEAELDEVEA
jgi:type I restriction enzyme S subunit